MAKIVKNTIGKTRRSRRKLRKRKNFDIIKNNTENSMKQEVRKNNKNLTIKLSVPLKTRRYNPYDESENDEMDNSEISVKSWILKW